ncbi:HD domain-containing protein [bacterium]|jgi:predicted HD superfamily hydrolase involved in NAD metabolism|nr:HD domain-containing protein [bacterium]
MTTSTISESLITKTLSKYVQPGPRFDHSLRVAVQARALAKHWNLDETIAYSAGILHDIAKQLTPDSVKIKSLPLDPLETLFKTYPKIWHSFFGPSLANHEIPGISPKILNAMKWHSTGKSKMSSLEKIVFIADFIEPGRTFNEVEKARELAFKSLDSCVFYIANYSILSLVERQLVIHPYTLKCRNHYLKTK